MRDNQFYCVKCQKKVMVDGDKVCVVKFRNGRMAERAKHAGCGTKMFKFVSADEAREVKRCSKRRKSKRGSKRGSKRSKRSRRRSGSKKRKSKSKSRSKSRRRY